MGSIGSICIRVVRLNPARVYTHIAWVFREKEVKKEVEKLSVGAARPRLARLRLRNNVSITERSSLAQT
jgi:hypothetical protein